MELQAVTFWPVAEAREDDVLVRAACDGDRAAFGLLYHRYARMVHGILLCRVPPREVDDLVQEVFLLALRKLHSLRDMSRFGNGPESHSLKFHACGPKVNAVSQFHAIGKPCFLQ